MSGETLKGGDLPTQNCTSVTDVQNWVWSLILASCLYVWKHTDVKLAFKCNNTISQLTKPVNNTISQLTKPVNNTI